MASTTEPNSGIKYGWDLGEQYKAEMDANLLLIGRIGFQCTVTSATNAPPGSPANGASHIVTATATGAWAGWEGSIAVWDGSVWNRYIPRNGWTAVDLATSRLRAYLSGAWTTGALLT